MSLSYRYCTLPLELSSRTDYAANGGNVRTTEVESRGPIERGENDLLADHGARRRAETAQADQKKDWNGIVFYKSEINHAAGHRRHVEDLHGRREMDVLSRTTKRGRTRATANRPSPATTTTRSA